MFVVVLRVYEICAAKKGWFLYGYSLEEEMYLSVTFWIGAALWCMRFGTGLVTHAWNENVGEVGIEAPYVGFFLYGEALQNG